MKNREFNPDLAIGDFDSLSEEGQKLMESLKGPEIIRLKPEKDDSDTQSGYDVAKTADCGSSWFSAAVVVSATDADAAMAVDADARQHNISCIGLKRRSHFSVSFFIYIYNADPGRSHYGRKTFKTNDTI